MSRDFRELARRPRLPSAPALRPPYLEAGLTAAVFAFVFYLVLGGA